LYNEYGIALVGLSRGTPTVPFMLYEEALQGKYCGTYIRTVLPNISHYV